MTADRDEVRAWAARFIGAASAEPLPLFASEEWMAAGGMTRVASAVRAAMAWLEDGDPHRRAYLLDLELDACWRAAEADHRLWRREAAKVRATADDPSHAELQRRRSA